MACLGFQKPFKLPRKFVRVGGGGTIAAANMNGTLPSIPCFHSRWRRDRAVWVKLIGRHVDAAGGLLGDLLEATFQNGCGVDSGGSLPVGTYQFPPSAP